MRDGSAVAAGSCLFRDGAEDGQVTVWDAGTWKQRGSAWVPGLRGLLHPSFAVANDGSAVAGLKHGAGELWIWRRGAGDPTHAEGEPGLRAVCAVSADGSLAAVGGDGGAHVTDR